MQTAVLQVHTKKFHHAIIGKLSIYGMVIAFQQFTIKQKPGLIFHTDQGANYRSRSFSDYLNLRAVTQSFSKPGIPYDNSVMETFFASMKQEELYRYNYRSEREFRAAVDRYIDFYNTKRPHKTLHYKTPAQKEENYTRGAMDSQD